MSRRKKYNKNLMLIGEHLREKRISLGESYKNRDDFIDITSRNLFNNKQWISSRYLASIELGHNMISIDLLIKLAYALETDPSELFNEILSIYRSWFNFNLFFDFPNKKRTPFRVLLVFYSST